MVIQLLPSFGLVRCYGSLVFILMKGLSLVCQLLLDGERNFVHFSDTRWCRFCDLFCV